MYVSVLPFVTVRPVQVILFVAAHVILSRTVYGWQIFAVGGNREAASKAGINHERVIITAFAISGFLSGVAAFLLVGRLGAASASLSTGALFISFAAAVVGGVSIYGGRGSVGGMVGGGLLMGGIANAINISEIPSEWVSVVAGAIILVAVFVDALRARRLPKGCSPLVLR